MPKKVKWEEITPFRVQIPPYTDMWMRGARFGEAIARCPDGIGGSGSLLRVKLDIGDKIVNVIENDCRLV